MGDGLARWRIEEHDVVESTNTLATERVRRAFAEERAAVDRLVIVATRQTAGRGQHGRTWESPPGGLYLSAVVQHVLPQQRALLPILAGVAITDALKMVGPHTAKIRWPNDVLLEGKKIAGVLCESVAQGSQWAAIIGIGLNIHIDTQALPPHLHPTSTSLHLHGNTESLGKVRIALLFALGAILHEAQEQGSARILTRARNRDYLFDKTVELQGDSHVLTGTACGIGDNGELLLKIDGQVQPFATATLLSINGTPLRQPD